MRSTDAIVTRLKERGLRVTPQRFAVLRNLLARTDHPTAEGILSDLNQQAPASSQATVYASLRALCDVGLVREVHLQGGVCRYDANVTPHHHFLCRSCGRIEDIPWHQLEQVRTDRISAGLQVDSVEVTLRGTCEQCQSQSPSFPPDH